MRFLETFQTADFFDTLISLSVAFVLGTLIGAERHYRLRSAGLRTKISAPSLSRTISTVPSL